jgi:hypothetical protein
VQGVRPSSWPLPSRVDLVRALVLALLTCLLWCAIYDRWTAAAWQTPLEYLSEPEKGDALSLLAAVKAARDGHYAPSVLINIPQLGAPFEGNWNDYPITEKPLLWLAGILARIIGLFAAANFAVMFAQVLAALSLYAAGRLLGVSWPWAFAGALVFAFSTYAFAHGLYHLTVLYYWHIPLCLVVCEWVLRGEGIRFGDRRFFFALVVAAVTGIQHVYYTAVFVQFLAWGGLVQMWRHGWRSVLPAVVLIVTAVAAFALMNVNTFAYHFLHGPNDDAFSRDYKWLEVYGLKLVDMVIPPPDHRVPWLAAWAAHHMKEVLLSPGEEPPADYLGIAGLAALGWLVVVSIRRLLEGKRVPLEAWLILWLVLEGGVGGLNGILGTMGLTLFRTTTRYTIFILAIVLLFAARRLSQINLRNKFVMPAAAGLVALLALADQTPPIVSADDLAATARDVTNDRDFARALDARLVPGGMVFQVPVMDFPEGPVHGIGAYDHLRLYLYSDSLRFSFGSDKGRPRAAWQKTVFQTPFPQALVLLQDSGFGAIYVNRNGFKDHGAQMEKTFQAAGLIDRIEDRKGDLFCVFLKPSPNPVLPAGPTN